jgi:hypothetical protein
MLAGSEWNQAIDDTASSANGAVEPAGSVERLATKSRLWNKQFSRHLSKDEARKLYANETRELSNQDRVAHVEGKKFIVREENFEPKGMDDEDAYFEEMHKAYLERGRQLQSDVENYDDVFWWEWEWLLKVGTEYYFRYEGSQTTPPCWDSDGYGVHWRVMKDPIRVAPHQMRELERLIAARRNPSCQSDTAGAPRAGRPIQDAVDVNRPLQSYHKLHRKVFCECKDWPSKFPQEREWCRNWRTDSPEDRLYDNPYNWPTDGF